MRKIQCSYSTKTELTHFSDVSRLQRQQAELQAEQRRLLQAQRSLYPERPIHLVLKVANILSIFYPLSKSLSFSTVRVTP